MRQELIDLILGELEGERAEEVRAQVRQDPKLARELDELTALFGLMRRGDEVEAPDAMRATVLAAAAKATRPSLWQRIRQVPSLASFRFRNSLGFRIAAYPLTLLSAAMRAMRDLLADFPADARTDERILDFAELRRLVGFDAYYEQESRYAARDPDTARAAE